MFSQTSDLPPNPMVGECYVKCKIDSLQSDWKRVNCKYLEYSELLVLFKDKSNLFSKKDEKIINRKLIKHLNKGFMLELIVNFDSNQTDSINSVNSFERSSELAKYLVSKKVDPNLLFIRSKGNELAKKKCENSTDCSKIYKENSKIYYRVMNYPGDNLRFNEECECWCKMTSSKESKDVKSD